VLAEVELVGAALDMPVDQRTHPKRERNGKNRTISGAATIFSELGMRIIRGIRNKDA
jgi:hypothetical protein